MFKLFPASQHIFLTPKLPAKRRAACGSGAGTGCRANFLLRVKKMRIKVKAGLESCQAPPVHQGAAAGSALGRKARVETQGETLLLPKFTTFRDLGSKCPRDLAPALSGCNETLIHSSFMC